MLSIFLRHVKHLGAVLMDTLVLCMERSGALLGCALSSSHIPPFSCPCPCPLPAAKSLLPVRRVLLLFFGWLALFVCLFCQALGSSLRNSAGECIPQMAVGQHMRTEIPYYKTFPTQVLQGKLFLEQRSPNPIDPEFLTPLAAMSS